MLLRAVDRLASEWPGLTTLGLILFGTAVLTITAVMIDKTTGVDPTLFVLVSGAALGSTVFALVWRAGTRGR